MRQKSLAGAASNKSSCERVSLVTTWELQSIIRLERHQSCVLDDVVSGRQSRKFSDRQLLEADQRFARSVLELAHYLANSTFKSSSFCSTSLPHSPLLELKRKTLFPPSEKQTLKSAAGSKIPIAHWNKKTFFCSIEHERTPGRMRLWNLWDFNCFLVKTLFPAITIFWDCNCLLSTNAAGPDNDSERVEFDVLTSVAARITSVAKSKLIIL